MALRDKARVPYMSLEGILMGWLHVTMEPTFGLFLTRVSRQCSSGQGSLLCVTILFPHFQPTAVHPFLFTLSVLTPGSVVTPQFAEIGLLF